MVLYESNEKQFNKALCMLCDRYYYTWDWVKNPIELKINVYFYGSPIMQNSHIVIYEEDLRKCDSMEELYKLIFDTWMKTGGSGM